GARPRLAAASARRTAGATVATLSLRKLSKTAPGLSFTLGTPPGRYRIVASWRRARRWTSSRGMAVTRIRIAAAAEAEPAPSPPSRKWYIRTVIVDQRLV